MMPSAQATAASLARQPASMQRKCAGIVCRNGGASR
jgi:hypothetical protein